jgi:hypothetical protein
VHGFSRGSALAFTCVPVHNSVTALVVGLRWVSRATILWVGLSTTEGFRLFHRIIRVLNPTSHD